VRREELMLMYSLQAAHWNLRYEGISDLASTSGPFASIFYTEEGDPNPFIVLCFKGTTPTNFPEVSAFLLIYTQYQS